MKNHTFIHAQEILDAIVNEESKTEGNIAERSPPEWVSYFILTLNRGFSSVNSRQTANASVATDVVETRSTYAGHDMERHSENI